MRAKLAGEDDQGLHMELCFSRAELDNPDFAALLVAQVLARCEEVSEKEPQVAVSDDMPSPLGFGSMEDFRLLVAAAEVAGVTVSEEDVQQEAREDYVGWQQQLKYRAMATGDWSYQDQDQEAAWQQMLARTRDLTRAEKYLGRTVARLSP